MNPSFSNGRRIQRVLPQLGFTGQPVVVSLGPYHHGKPDLQMGEEYKHKVLERFISASGKCMEFFYIAVLEMVGEIRSCYVGISTEDGALAEMMLLDACFLIHCMEISAGSRESLDHFFGHLGMCAARLAFQDTLLLENQIPLYVVKLLISMRWGDEGDMLLYNHLSKGLFGGKNVTFIPGEVENQPLHLLEAYRRLCINSNSNTFENLSRQLEFTPEVGTANFSLISVPFRSVTQLKEKGIYFRPSSYSLSDIRFTSNGCYGVLHLPIWFMTPNSKIFFSNIIAHEISPEGSLFTGLQVTSYINIMKTLIQKPEDVKELRENNIMFSTLGSDEEIVKIFKEIDTFGAKNLIIFGEVKYGLERHCRSKARTWIAELIHTYLRSPWTAIGLLVAMFIVILTSLQTYYTMNPVS